MTAIEPAPHPATPCREYRGSRTAKGYGRLRGELLHRWVVEQVEGRPLAPGEIVMHRCDNPSCFLYEHLQRASQSENIVDAVRKGRHRMGRRPGESNPAAVLTVENVVEIRRLLGTITKREIGRRFGVAETTVGRIARGETWR